LEQHDFDGAMSRIWNGVDIVAEFKMQGIGPDNFTVFKVGFSVCFRFVAAVALRFILAKSNMPIRYSAKNRTK
jgi:hypothetical protein